MRKALDNTGLKTVKFSVLYHVEYPFFKPLVLQMHCG